VGAGMKADPTDRITELLEENSKLRAEILKLTRDADERFEIHT